MHEPFTADFCRYPVLSEVALTYRCNLSCGFCYAGCGVSGVPAGWSETRVMADDEVCRVLDVIRRAGNPGVWASSAGTFAVLFARRARVALPSGIEPLSPP